ncbi:MAG: NUDIX hydrolase [Caldilineaceae bacterium]|nr:NUDIX hydrolase [Caldilineaceae bacterium]
MSNSRNSARAGNHSNVSRLARSSGGVAFRRSAPDEPVEIALISTRGGTRWQLPKGSCEPGETLVETAVREVEEETGLRTEPVIFLKTVTFWYWDTYRKDPPVRVRKMVDFYLLRVEGGRLSDASHEVDDVAWFSLEEAQSTLTYETERQVLSAAVEALESL